jgi:peptidoglycan/xylan/chitin deacetylase (PgdA/CDA1 family)
MVLKNIFLASTFLVANLFFANAQLAGKWPAVDVAPPFEDEWKSLVDETKLPAAPVVKQVGDCPKDGTDPFCSWTCTRCVKPDDVSVCPKAKDWGLTFDDGPTEQTKVLLDTLDKTPKTKVTLFAVGSRIISNPDALKRAVTSGHQVGVHTWSHTPLTTQTNQQIIAEIKWTERAIQAACGVTPNVLRPPQGDYDDRVRAIATALGYKIVLWDLDTFDWKIKSEPTARTAQNVYDDVAMWVKNTTTTTGHISLQHDLYTETVSLVPKILETITGAGFDTKTVGDCLSLPLHNALAAPSATPAATPAAAPAATPKTASAKTEKAPKKRTIMRYIK